MSLDFTLNISAREGFESPITGQQEAEADIVKKISDTVPGSCADYRIDTGFPADDDRLHALVLIASDDCTITFRGAADVSVGTAEALAGIPVLFYTGIGFSIDDLVSGDVLAIEIDNSGNAEDITIVGRIASDNGPCPSP